MSSEGSVGYERDGEGLLGLEREGDEFVRPICYAVKQEAYIHQGNCEPP